MKFTYETQGAITYLVCELDGGEMIDNLTLGMLTNNHIAGVAPVLYTEMNGQRFLKYNISAKVSSNQFFGGRMNKHRTMQAFSNILDAICSADDYMIDPGCFSVAPEHVMINVSNCETALVCIPVISDADINVRANELFKNIVLSTQFDPSEDTAYVTQLISYINDAESFSIYGLRDLVQKIKSGAYIPAPQSPAQGQAAAKPQNQAGIFDSTISIDDMLSMTGGNGTISSSTPPQAPINAPEPPKDTAPANGGYGVKINNNFGQMPPAQPNVPPVQPNVPPVQPNVPPVQPNVPPVQPNVPHAQPNVPNVNPAMRYDQVGHTGGFPNTRNGGNGPKPMDGPVPMPPVNNGPGFAIPGQAPSHGGAPAPQQNKPPKKEAAHSDGEKKMTFLGLLAHYNKENADLYKKQKEEAKAAKKNAVRQPVGNVPPMPGQQPPAPGQRPPVPGQRPPVPGQRPPVPGQQPPMGGRPPQPPVNGGAYPASGFNRPPVCDDSNTFNPPAPQKVQPVPIQNSFNETTVLSPISAGGETTVLSAAAMAPSPRLIRSKTGESIDINKPVFRIGKEKSYVDYFIGDNTAISRSHANIHTENGEYFIEDTNSTNHTYINGKLITSNIKTKLTSGDKVRLANEDFTFTV